MRAWYKGPGVYYNTRLLAITPRRGLRLPVAASWGIGVVSFAFGPRLDVFDLLGLANVLDSHLALDHAGVPGHEKPMPPAWTAALLVEPGTPIHVDDFRRPQLVIPLRPWPSNDREFARQVAWARAALECPPIRTLLQRSTEPLTASRFFSNLAHSVGDSRMRIPPDPHAAYRRFCGPGFPVGTR
jgi:arabinofuranosyltransferase